MTSARNRVILRTSFCATLLALLLAFAPTRALAVSYASNNTWTVAPMGDHMKGYSSLMFEDAGSNPTITNIKSSNTKVAKVSVEDDFIWVEYGSKTGKATISCTVNGVNLSKVFTVKYTSPVQRFTVAGKSITRKFRTKQIFTDNKTYKNKKVVVQAKSGWLITGVMNTKNFKESSRTYKGRKSLTVKIKTVAPYDGLRITFKNTKTGEEQEVDYLRGYKGTGYRPVAG